MRIGTRGSRLALWQAQAVAEALAAAGHGPCEIVVVRTSGDRLQERPLSDEGGKRLFVKELEEALFAGEVDLAVHSAKDLPEDLPSGLAIGGVLPREDPRDAIVLPSKPEGRQAAGASAATGSGSWRDVMAGKIGTGSIRRIAQLRAVAPDARFAAVRGNVDTRLRKLDEGQYDALVLAAAGLRRLGFADRISAFIPIDQCVPAPGQGTIAIEIREDDAGARAATAALDDGPTRAALDAERAVVKEIGGGCQLPLGAIALAKEGALELHAIVIAPDGSRAARARTHGPPSDARELGRRAADELAAAGAREILDGLGIRR